MSNDNILVIIARAGDVGATGARWTEQGLKLMASMADTPYIKYREAQHDVVWDGPAEAYYERFHSHTAAQAADTAIKRAMRKA